MQGVININGKRSSHAKVWISSSFLSDLMDNWKFTLSFQVFDEVKIFKMLQTAYHELTLSGAQEITYTESGKAGFLKYLSPPLSR